MRSCIISTGPTDGVDPADELADYIMRLYKSRARRCTSATFSRQPGEMVFVLESPHGITNRELRWRAPEPQLADECYVVGSFERDVIWAFGETRVTTLWAVYTLLENMGIVFTLKGDIYPPEVPRPSLSGVTYYEPRQARRSWRLLSELMTGPIGWSTEQAERVVIQLAKQRYNGIHLDIWPHTPFVDLVLDGVRREQWSVGFGDVITISDGMPGYEHFGYEGRLRHPVVRFDLPFKEANRLAVDHVNRVIATAKGFGMEVGVGVMLFDLPPEFARFLERPESVVQAGMLTVAEGGRLDAAGHLRVVAANYAAHRDAFPEADEFLLIVPEHARNIDHFSAAWQAMDSRFGLSKRFDLDVLLADRETTMLVAGGPDRARDEAQMTVVMIAMLHNILHATGIFRMAADEGRTLALTAGLSCPHFIPIISEMLWDGGELEVITGYTSSRAVRSMRHLDGFSPTRGVIRQTLTLQDDNVGSLMQESSRSVSRLVEFGAANGWKGYTTRFWPPGDLDPMSAVLRATSWGASTAEAAYAVHFHSTFGASSVRPLQMAFGLVEDATMLLDLHHLGILFPMVDHIEKTVGVGKRIVDESLWHVRALYAEAQHIVESVQSRTPPPTDQGKVHLAYHGARLEFSIAAIDGLIAIHDGNAAMADGDHDLARRRYGQAVTAFTDAIRKLADHASDDSDWMSVALYHESMITRVRRAASTLLADTVE